MENVITNVTFDTDKSVGRRGARDISVIIITFSSVKLCGLRSKREGGAVLERAFRRK